MGVVASIVHASFRTVLNKMLQQCEALEDNTPGSRPLVLHRLPHDLGHNGIYRTKGRIAKAKQRTSGQGKKKKKKRKKKNKGVCQY